MAQIDKEVDFSKFGQNQPAEFRTSSGGSSSDGIPAAADKKWQTIYIVVIILMACGTVAVWLYFYFILSPRTSSISSGSPTPIDEIPIPSELLKNSQ
jgi:hypothetical protein